MECLIKSCVQVIDFTSVVEDEEEVMFLLLVALVAYVVLDKYLTNIRLIQDLDSRYMSSTWLAEQQRYV